MSALLHVECSGQGPDVVLLHGWGLHGGVWEALATFLARRARVHVVDLPGHGRSPPIAGDWSQWVAALARAIPRGAIVCGWSLGGQLGLALAGAYPEHIAALVLVSTSPRFVAGADWAHGIAGETLRQFRAQLAADPEAALDRFLVLTSRKAAHPRLSLARLRAVLDARPRAAAETLAAGLGFLMDNDLRPLLPRVRVPVQVIHADPDAIVPAQAGAWLASALARARLALVPGGGHAPFFTDPQACAAVIEPFIGQVHAQTQRRALSHR